MLEPFWALPLSHLLCELRSIWLEEDWLPPHAERPSRVRPLGSQTTPLDWLGLADEGLGSCEILVLRHLSLLHLNFSYLVIRTMKQVTSCNVAPWVRHNLRSEIVTEGCPLTILCTFIIIILVFNIFILFIHCFKLWLLSLSLPPPSLSGLQGGWGISLVWL